MRKLWLLLPLLGMVFLVAPTADACPKKPKCVCDCNAKCRYGETCKKVKKCKVYKACEKKLVCSCGKDKKCDSKKVKLCHIPPGNPFNAHTICVGKSAVQAHLDHGDYLGKCHFGCEKRKVCQSKVCCKKVKKCTCNKYNPKCPPCECPEPDAGVPDMTPVEPDAGVPDMTPVEPDAGVPDMTPVEPDAGVPDMTPTEPDMGPSPRPDMEVIEVDGGGCPACPDSSTEEPEDDLELVGGGGCSTGGGAGTAAGAGLVIGFILLAVGILKRSKLWLIIAVLLLAGSALGSVAHAAPPVNNFKTAPSVNDYYTTMNPRTLGHLDFNGQIMLNYSHKPLRIIRKSTGETVDTVLRFRMNLDIALALGLYDVFELGFVVPTSAGQGAGNLAPLGTKLNNHDFQLADFKDLRIIPKFNLGSVNLSESTFLRFGLAFPITAPTGDRERLLGENGPTVAPTLLAGLDHKYFSLGLNVGVLARHNQDHNFRNQTINSSDEFLYGVGLNVPLVEDFGWLHKLDLIGDVWGSVQFAQQDKEEVSLEAMGGLRAHLKHGIVANVAAGGGLTKGYGVPEYRVMWGVGWEFDWQKSKPCPTCDKPKPCPPSKTVVKPVPVPVIVEKTLVIPPVYFDTDKHNLRPDALKTLKQTVKLLKENMWVKRVRLEGHCDHRMPHKYNDKLALRRVNTVKKYLVDNGISVKRLEARGYGERQRVDTTQKEPGMQKNRRVEFHILEVE